MKKIKCLFVLIAVLLHAVNAHAELVDGVRKHPEPKASKLQFETEFYLYNVGAKGLLCAGNKYGTHSSVGTNGLWVKAESYSDDGSTIILRNSVEVGQFTGFREIFFANIDGDTYIDRNGQEDYFWKVEENGDYYRFSMDPSNPNYSEWYVDGSYWGWDESLDNGMNTNLWAFLQPSDEHHVDWIFTTKEDYEIYLKEYDIYKKAESLRSNIIIAEALNIDVAEAKAVYANESSTADELLEATGNIIELISQNKPEGSVDLTDYIINPNGSDNMGWEGNQPTFREGVAEHWNMSFDTYQVVEGIPNGVYTLSLQAFYRPGLLADDSYDNWISGTEDNVMLYADNGIETVSTPIKNIFEGATTESMGYENGGIGNGELSKTLEDGTTLYIPNDMTSAAAYFADSVIGPKYISQLSVLVVDNKLKIGINNEKLIYGHWALWDNWKLTYHGGEEDAYSNMLKSAVDNALDIINGAMVTTSLAEDFTNKLNTLEATTAEEYMAAQAVIKEETAKIKANIAAWSAYKEKIEYVKTLIENGTFEISNENVQTVAGYINTVGTTNIEALKLTTEELTNETNSLEDKITKLWSEAVKVNTDVTSAFFTNTDFSQDLQGWEWDQTMNSPWINSNIVQFSWNSDLYQKTDASPSGLYEMTVNGYYRKDGEITDYYKNYKYRSDNGINVKSNVNAYINNGYAPFMTVFEEKVPVNELYSDAFIPYEDSPYWYPTYDWDAATAFEAGRYINTVYGIVKESGTPLCIGAKEKNGAYAYLDNFKVIYRGYQMEYVSAAYDQTVEIIRNKYFGKEIRELVNPIIETGEAAKAAGDSIALFEALSSMQEFNAKIDSSAAEFEKLLDEAISILTADDDFTGALIDESKAFAESVIAGIKNGEYTTDEANSLYWELYNKRIVFNFGTGNYNNRVRGGSDVVIPITFENKADNITAFQIRINLPEGISIPMNEDDEYDIWLNEERVTNSHTLASSLQEDGSILVAVYSSKNAALKGTEGDMIYVRVAASEDTYEGGRDIRFNDIRISTKNAIEKELSDLWAWINIVQYTPGDVNNDGAITSDDRDAIINNINEIEVPNFKFEAADINEDGYVTPYDLIQLNYMLLGIVNEPVEDLTGAWVSAENNRAGKGVIFNHPINLTNEGDITAIRGRIYLSDFLSVEDIELSDRVSDDHTISFKKDGNTVLFVIYSPTNAPISGTEGTIMNLKMKISEEAPTGYEGSCQCNFTGIYSPGGCVIQFSNTWNWIMTITPADADGDGMVTINDMNSALNAIVGRPDWNFVQEAADVNNDGEFTVRDIVAIIRMLLNQGVAEAEVAAVAESFGFSFIPEEKTIRSRKQEEWTVAMSNTGDITAFQCDIYLPNEIYVNNIGDAFDIRLSERASATHNVISGMMSNGAIRVVVYSDQNEVISGTDGDLFTLGIEASLEAATSSQIDIRNIRVCTPDEVEYRGDDVTAYLNVKHYTPADVDGNGNISIVDVVAVVNGLMGIISDNFVFDAADMNHDGQITIVDVVGVVNVLLNGGSTQTRATESDAFGQKTVTVPVTNVTRSAAHQDLYVTDMALNGESTTLTVSLENAVSYTGVQFDMMLPENMRIADVSINGNSGHTAAFRNNRVVVYSMSNKAFTQNNAVMTITLEGSMTDNEDMAFTNIYAASADGKERALADAYVTDIQNIASELSVKAQDGCIIIDSPMEQSATIASVSGIAQKIKLTAGTNRIPVDGKGIYIVKVGKTVVKTNVR